MEVKIDGVVYESEAATDWCSGCVAIDSTGLCSDITDQVSCFDVIWIKKEDQ